MGKQRWIGLAAVIGIITIAIVLLRAYHVDFSGVTEGQFKERIDRLGVWGPVAYCGIYLLRPLIFFPASILSASAGFIWGPLWGFLYLQIAANISSTAEFLLARTVARKQLEPLVRGRVGELDRRIEQHGFLTVLLIRLIPNVAWDIQNVTLGLTRVRFRDYFIATLIGIMPGSFALVFFGASLIKVLYNPRHLWWLAAAVALFGALFALRRYLKLRHSPGAVQP